jgi:hypothetical protein
MSRATPEAAPTTRTPWRVVGIVNGRIVGDETAKGVHDIQIHGPNGTVATVYRPGDARAIVTAVNGHAALVEFGSGVAGDSDLLADDNARLRDALRSLLRETDQHATGDCAKLRAACDAARAVLS